MALQNKRLFLINNWTNTSVQHSLIPVDFFFFWFLNLNSRRGHLNWWNRFSIRAVPAIDTTPYNTKFRVGEKIQRSGDIHNMGLSWDSFDKKIASSPPPPPNLLQLENFIWNSTWSLFKLLLAFRETSGVFFVPTLSASFKWDRRGCREKVETVPLLGVKESI